MAYAKSDSAATFLIFLPSASITSAAELSRPEHSWALIELVQLNWPQRCVMRIVLYQCVEVNLVAAIMVWLLASDTLISMRPRLPWLSHHSVQPDASHQWSSFNENGNALHHKQGDLSARIYLNNIFRDTACEISPPLPSSQEINYYFFNIKTVILKDWNHIKLACLQLVFVCSLFT